MNVKDKDNVIQEKELKAPKGIGVLLLTILLYILSIVGVILSVVMEIIPLGIVCGVYMCLGWIPWCGIKVLNPNEAYVLTLFGKYVGTLKHEGIFFVNPFCSAINPTLKSVTTVNGTTTYTGSKKISLKAMTLDNNKQKINDEMGNPIEVGIVVIWKIHNTAKAVFNVDNFQEFVSIQADSALRDVIRKYPYDATDESDKISLRNSSQEIADEIQKELQSRVEVAGIEVCEARITHLAYAPEIASAMLQRQQATAIIDARQKIVEGAVGMVEMALDKLSEKQVCELDEERKAVMVSNLLVVLCGNKDAQPVVNSGSIY
ncbi:MAG: SPFH domain-containing protein [Oscillospiraceae bacterium]